MEGPIRANLHEWGLFNLSTFVTEKTNARQAAIRWA
jgi:hypothetical protein